MKGFYIPENNYNCKNHTQRGRLVDITDLQGFVEKHFRGGPVEHTLPDGKTIHGFNRYLQEYEPMNFNDTVMRLFDKHEIEAWEDGFLGNILFY
jgi:hypothetical protein